MNVLQLLIENRGEYNMLSLLSLILLFCSLISLGLFIFILRFAVKTEMVITTTIFTFIVTIGLFSWTMLSAS